MLRRSVEPKERLTTPLVAGLPERLRGMALRDPRQLQELDPATLAAVLDARLGEDHDVHGERLAPPVRDAALGGARGSLELSEVAAALNEARAEHIVYDPAVRYTGAVARDGSLHESSERASTAVTEPRLTERIVSSARCPPAHG